MELNRDSKLLRIFIDELDKTGGGLFEQKPLYEALVYTALKHKMAGATVIRGVLSFGATAHIHTTRFLEISMDLPLIVEIIDHEDRIKEFLEIANDMIDKAGCGALITIEKAEVIYYKPKKL